MSKTNWLSKCTKATALHLEHESYVEDILAHPDVQLMKTFPHHKGVTTLEHSKNVSYYTFVLCKKLGLDARSAARAGMLHDLFLYDWHERDGKKTDHTYGHPKIALANALERFELNDIEKEMILKHMYPAVEKVEDLPKFAETYAIAMVDKAVACGEYVSIMERFVSSRLVKVDIGHLLADMAPRPMTLAIDTK